MGPSKMTFKTPFALNGDDSKLRAGSIAIRSLKLIQTCALALTIVACSGGGSTTSRDGVDPTPAPVAVCNGSCANAGSFLTVADVQKVMAQAIAEAQARGVN